jgi:photosystem II stability/assembly factor-like uncharacterized protein
MDVDYSVLDIHNDVNVQKVTFLNDNIGYACGGNKSQNGVIYKTTDAGNSWQMVYSNTNLCVYDVAFVNDTLGYACGENLLILKTIDAGAHWVVQSPFLPDPGFGGSLRNIFCFDANTVYIAGGIGYSTGITYKTFNQGTYWIYNNFEHELRSVWYINKYTGFYSGYGVIYKTDDSLNSHYPLSVTGDFFMSMSFTDNHTGYACGYDGGIYKTTDVGNTWSQILNNNNAIVSSRHFNYIQFTNANKGYVVGNTGLIVFTDNAGSDWNLIKKFTDDNLFSVCIRGSKVYISGAGGRIYRLNL